VSWCTAAGSAAALFVVIEKPRKGCLPYSGSLYEFLLIGAPSVVCYN